MNYQGQARLSALQRSALSPTQRQDHCAPNDKGGFLLKMKEEEEEDENEKKNENEEGVGVGEVVEREWGGGGGEEKKKVHSFINVDAAVDTEVLWTSEEPLVCDSFLN